MQKRIGILTYFTDPPYFNDINPGMNLQAYSVFEAVKDQNPYAEVEMIRYHSWWAIWRIYVSSMTLDTLKQDVIQFIKYYKFSKSFALSKKALVSKNSTKAYQFINSLGYDAIYVGSDTLLELFRAKTSEDITAYWLNRTVDAKKFMIAASARDTSYSKLTDGQKIKLNDSIQTFDMLGIRDNATYELINNFTNKKDKRLKIVPDPTFTFDIDYSFAQKYVEKKGLLKTGKPIICFHLLKTNLFAQPLADKLREKGFIIASLRPAKYADIILKDLSPLEFAGIFKFFHLTLTHRFHDSVFCIKNLSPLLLYPPSKNYVNESGNSKQSSLMDSFNIREECFIKDIESETIDSLFNKILQAPKNFEEKKVSINQTLFQYKEDFTKYVKETSENI
nr:polysaccharide pyruvyl transferase family protein [uncultured Draconibacterium sp.]